MTLACLVTSCRCRAGFGLVLKARLLRRPHSTLSAAGGAVFQSERACGALGCVFNPALRGYHMMVVLTHIPIKRGLLPKIHAVSAVLKTPPGGIEGATLLNDQTQENTSLTLFFVHGYPRRTNWQPFPQYRSIIPRSIILLLRLSNLY